MADDYDGKGTDSSSNERKCSIWKVGETDNYIIMGDQVPFSDQRFSDVTALAKLGEALVQIPESRLVDFLKSPIGKDLVRKTFGKQ